MLIRIVKVMRQSHTQKTCYDRTQLLFSVVSPFSFCFMVFSMVSKISFTDCGGTDRGQLRIIIQVTTSSKKKKKLLNLNHITGSSSVSFILKLPPTTACSPENGMCCVVVTTASYICTFRIDTSDISKQTLSYAIWDDQRLQFLQTCPCFRPNPILH